MMCCPMARLVGRIYCDTAVSDAVRWFWALAYGHHQDRSPTHGRAPTREQAMAAFAKSWWIVSPALRR